jgi:pSer/pThr/pTyr-binding forkhead associated (FHA) protein
LHARLYRRSGSLWVEDLGSTNGTWVNAERIGTNAKLGKGDLLQVGGTVFEVAR